MVVLEEPAISYARGTCASQDHQWHSFFPPRSFVISRSLSLSFSRVRALSLSLYLSLSLFLSFSLSLPLSLSFG